METLWQDVKYGARQLARNPGFTAVAVLTLALGIGANTAIFSMVNGVLLRSLPYGGGDRLVVLRQSAPGIKTDNLPFSVKEIRDFRELTQTLDEVVEFHDMEFTMIGHGDPQQVHTGVVSANFFEVLGVEALFGRTFLPGEDQPGTEPIMVLSHEYWKNKLGGDPNIIGQTFELTGKVHTVVGILPPVPQYPVEVDVYMPVSHCPTRSSERFIENREARMMNVFGRLRAGVTLEQGRSDVSRIAASFPREHPDVYPAHIRYTASASALKTELTKQAQAPLLFLLFAAGFVLLIACANVANLMLSRLLGRERELAVRTALGAGRGRLLRQLLTESTLVSLAGGALGFLVAVWGLDLLIAFAARFTTRAQEITIDGTVLLFTLLLSVGTGLLFGAGPAMKSLPNLSEALNESGSRSSTGTGTHRLRSVLLAAQVAVSLVLLVGAGLMLRSLLELQRVDAGFRAENVLSMRVGMNWRGFDRNVDNRMEFFRRLLERVEAMPGVLSAGLSGAVPLSRQQGFPQDFRIEGQTVLAGEPPPVSEVNVATPGYFRTLGVPFLRGRDFAQSDDVDAPKVAIVNDSLARRHWRTEGAVGRRISLNQGQDWWTIVGVVGDTPQFGLDQETADEIYLPFWQGVFASRLVVRATSDPERLEVAITKAIRGIAPDQTIDTVLTMEHIRSESIAPTRLTTLLVGVFAALALAIAVAGVGGVMALLVSQRTHEFGIRMALGAQPRDILMLVVGQGMMLVLVGLAAGIAGSLALTQFMAGLLFGIEPTDPATFLAVGVSLLLVGAVACWVPARRATRVDPMVALRYE